MFKKSRIVSLLLAVILFSSTFMNNLAFAMELSEEIQESSNSGITNEEENIFEDIQTDNFEKDEPDNKEPKELGSTGEEIPEEIIENVPGEDISTGETIETSEIPQDEHLINYVAIDSPYIESDDIQKIVVSIGDGTWEIENAKLTLKNELNGDVDIIDVSRTEDEDGSLIFKRQYDTNLIQSIVLESLSYDIGEESFKVNFAEIGIDARYGVNKYVETEPDIEAADDEENVDLDIFSFDKDGIPVSEESLEDALNKSSSDTKPSQASITSNTGNGFSTNLSLYGASGGKYVVVLDPGHDATHAGASANGLREETLNLKIAKYCKEHLERYSGVKVYMTRSGESCPYPGTSSGDDNLKRVQYAASVGADAYVAIHLNSAAAGANGVEVYYPNSSYNSSIGSKGSALASKILSRLVDLGLDNRGVKTRLSSDGYSDYYGVIRNSKTYGFPGVIVEHAFLTGSKDASWLSKESNLKNLGIRDAEGIAAYFGLSLNQYVEYKESDKNILIKSQLDTAKGGFGSTTTIAVTGTPYIYGMEYVVTNKSTNASKTYKASSTDISGIKAWYIDFPHSDLKSEEGNKEEYFAEAWILRKDGSKYKIRSTEWSVEKSTKLKVNDGNLAQENFKKYVEIGGKIVLYMTGLNSTYGLKSLDVRAWINEGGNRKNIKTFKAENVAGNDYGCSIDVVDFDCEWGNYGYEVVLTDDNGVETIVASSDAEGITVNKSIPEFKDVNTTATDNYSSMYYALKNVPGTEGKFLKSIILKVWSEKIGEDLAIEYHPYISGNSHTYYVPFSDFGVTGKYHGRFICEYADGTTANYDNEYTVEEISAIAAAKNIDKLKGTFDINVSNILPDNKKNSNPQVDVIVGIQDEENFYTYSAKKNTDTGVYTATADISKHKYILGKYKADVYIKNDQGIRVLVKTITDIDMTSEATKSAAASGKYETITVTNLPGTGKYISFVKFKVISPSNKSKTYTASFDAANQSYKYNVPLSDFKEEGDYKVDVTVTRKDKTVYTNKEAFLEEVFSFHVAPPSADVKITDDSIDIAKGKFGIDVYNVVSDVDITKVEVTVNSTSKDAKTYTATALKDEEGKVVSYHVDGDIKNHSYNSGIYSAQVYITNAIGLKSKVATLDSIDINSRAEFDEPKISGDQNTVKLTVRKLPGAESYLKGAIFSVYSDANGTKKAKTYTAKPEVDLTTNETIYSYEIPIKDHKSAGVYHAQAYYKTPSGNKLIAEDEFTIESAVADVKLIEGSKDYDKGQFDLNIDIREVKGDVTKVEALVWRSEDGSLASARLDSKTYTAVKTENSYVVNVDIKNHKCSTGLYLAEVYVTTANNVRSLAGVIGDAVDMGSDAIVECDLKDEISVRLSAKNVPGNKTYVKNVQFKVWAVANGEKKAKTYTAKKDIAPDTGDITYYIDVPIKDHKAAGEYKVYTYSSTQAGSKLIDNGLSFNIKGPSAVSIIQNENREDGLFDVKTDSIVANGGVSKVETVVWWSKNMDGTEKKDSKTYTASPMNVFGIKTKESNGDVAYYLTNVNIKNHKYNCGYYFAQVFVTTGQGIRYAVNDLAPVDLSSNAMVEVDVDANEENVELKALLVPGNESYTKSIVFTVYTFNEKNKKVSKSYTVKKANEGIYSVSVPISNYKLAGDYYVSAVYSTPGGNKTIVTDEKFFSIKEPKAKVEGVSGANDILMGTFDLRIYDIESLSNVTKAEAEIYWSADGGKTKKDAKTYVAVKTDNEFNVTANLKNHKYNFEYYYANIYLTTAQGIRSMACSLDSEALIDMTPKADVEVTPSDDLNFAKVIAKNIPGIKSYLKGVKFTVWSDANGQKKAKTYTAQKIIDEESGETSYEYNVPIKDHKSAGDYIVYTYAVTPSGNRLACDSTRFNIPAPTADFKAQNIDRIKGTFDVLISNIDTKSNSKVTKVEAVIAWSEDKGITRKDAKTYLATVNERDEAENPLSYKLTADVKNHKYYLTDYTVEVYITTEQGIRALVNEKTEIVDMSPITEIRGELNEKETIATISASKVPGTGTFANSVKFRVFNDTNPSKYKDYTAKKGDIDYYVDVPIKDFGQAGTYSVQTFVILKDKTTRALGEENALFEIALPTAEISEVSDIDEYMGTFTVHVTNVSASCEVTGVSVAAWVEGKTVGYNPSEKEDGKANEYVAMCDIGNSGGETGTYNYQAYITTEQGISTPVGSIKTFNIDRPQNNGVSYLSVEDDYNIFMKVVNPYAPNSIKNMQFTVNINGKTKTFNGTKKYDNGVAYFTYSTDVSVFNYASGTYTVNYTAVYKDGKKDTFESRSAKITAMPNLNPIMGTSQTNASQLARYYSARASFPSYYGMSLQSFCQMYIDECAREGVRAEVAFAQAMKETNFLRYTGRVPIWANNFAGMGAIDSNASAFATFTSVRTGIRAQVQHLKAYASTAPLSSSNVDPRFGYVSRGCARYVEWLGQKENPSGKGWATATGYGYSLVNDYMRPLLKS